jgi:O-antigen/teichoic acid export membrane protein
VSEATTPTESAAPPRAHGNVVKNALYLVLGQVGSTALALLTNAALGRLLGVTDFGVFFLVTSIGWFAHVFVEWGQPQILIREVARRHERAGELLGSAFALRSIATVLMVGFTVLTLWVMGYEARVVGLAALLVGTNLPTTLSMACSMIFRGYERMDSEALSTVVSKILVAAFILPTLLLGGRLTAIIVAQGAAGLGALAFGLVQYRRLRGTPLQATRAAALELFREGAPLVLGNVGLYAQLYIDAIVLTKLATPEAVGWFAAARTFVGTLIAPANLIGSANFPQLARAAGNEEAFKRSAHALARPLVGLGALGAVGTWLFADFAVSLVYKKDGYGPAVQVLQSFAPAILLLFITILFGNALLALGKARLMVFSKLASIVLGTGLNLLLIPVAQRYLGNGGIAVALVFALTELVTIVWAFYLVPPGTFDRSVVLDLLRALAAGGATILLGNLLLPVPVLVRLPVCVACFGAAAVGLRLFSIEDFRGVAAQLKRRGQRA